jgi:beta-lactamase class A
MAGVLPDPDAAYGLIVEDVASGARIAINERRVFPSASLYKLALAWEVLRRVDDGSLDLEAPLTIVDDDATEPEPFGGLAPGADLSVQDALSAMLTVSSNAAGHALLRLVGRHEFNAAMQQLGLTDTRVPDDSAEDDPQQQSEAVTSAADMARLLWLIAHNQTLSSAGHDRLVDLMARGGPPDALRDTLPGGIDVYDKTGNLADASNVTALLQSARGMVVLVVLDEGVDPGEARGVIAGLGQAAYDAVLR